MPMTPNLSSELFAFLKYVPIDPPKKDEWIVPGAEILRARVGTIARVCYYVVSLLGQWDVRHGGHDS